MSTWIADHSAAVLDFQDLTPHITYLEEYSYAVASGGFADIFRAKYRGKDVAVKVIRSRSSDEEKVQTWFTKVKREMSVWSMLDHDNILPFLGFCDFQGAPIMPRNSLASMCPVSPWMKNGSAPRYIRDNPHVDRVALLLGIAKGLSYLHSRKIIHGDLKGENVLITDKGTPVLADFGLAAFDDIDYTLMSSSTGGVKGTSRWVAPELLRGGDTASKVSRGSDIWALGCIFLEVVALMKPYAAYKNDLPILFAIMRHRLPHESLSTSTRVLYKQENISSDLVEEVEPPPPAFARHPGLWDLCLKCWDFEPTSRPKCSDISDFIAQLQSTRVPSTPLDSSIAYEPPLLSTPETSNKSIPPLDELFKEFTDLKIDVIYPENPHEALRSFRYAEIYKGQFKGSWVALKVVEVGHWSGVHEKVLLKKIFREMSTWSKLKHDNILPLLGFFFSSSLSVSLVTPWMEQGDAPNYLKGHPHTCRVNLLLGITKGLAYIHSQGLYHGDLKGGNILISDEGRPMLSSFTRTTSHNLSFIESNTPTRIRLGTTRWMAPEVIMESAPGVTPKSDMWALGCVFLELIASILPYHHCQNVNQLILTLIADQYPYPQASLTSEPLPFKQYPGLWSVCIRCWDFTPSSRPQCQDIQGLLTWLKYMKDNENPQTMTPH